MMVRALHDLAEAGTSAPATIQYFQKLVDLDLPVALGAGVESVGHAVPQMVRQRLLLDPVEGGADGTDLGQHVDAVAVLLDHARDTAHLALDATEPGELGFLQSLIHGLNYTQVGYKWQA